MADQYPWGWQDPFAAPWYDVPPYDGTRHQGTVPRPQPYGPEPIGYSGGTVPRNPYDPYSTYDDPNVYGRPVYTPQQQYAAGGGAIGQQATMAHPMQAAQQYTGPHQFGDPYNWAASSPGAPAQAYNPYIRDSSGPRAPNPNAALQRSNPSYAGGGGSGFGPGNFIERGSGGSSPQQSPAAPRVPVTYGRSALPTQMGSSAYGIGVGNMASNQRRGSRTIGSVNMDAVGSWMQLPPDQRAALSAQGLAVTVNGQDPFSGAAPWKVSGGYSNPSGPMGKQQQLQQASQRAQVGQAMNAPKMGGAPGFNAQGFPLGQMGSPGRYGNRFLQNNMAMASTNAQTRAGADQLLQGAAATGNMDRSKPMLAQYYGSRDFARSRSLADQQDRDRQYGLQRDALDFNQMQALAQAQAQAGNYWRQML